jgi:hypothetical protein
VGSSACTEKLKKLSHPPQKKKKKKESERERGYDLMRAFQHITGQQHTLGK